MKNNDDISIDNFDLLEKNSVFNLEEVSKWLRIDSVKYKDYVHYVMAVENLRYFVLILTKNIINQKK